MKILLLGATGQIGRALLDALVQARHEVTALVRYVPASGFPEQVRLLQASEFTVPVFQSALSGMDAAIYGVGLPEQFAFDTGVFDRVNHGILRDFLEVMAASPVRRLVYLSTYEVFEAREGKIRESHAPAKPDGMTPYFQAMIKAYQLILEVRDQHGLRLTTIHPAALYGGMNTGDGFTNLLENLINWRVLKMPAIVGGRFPVVHARSLASAIVLSLDHEGAFLVSDGMTSMRDMARRLRQQVRSYVPLQIPRFMAYLSAGLFEWCARLIRRRPILARVQVDFITGGNEPVPDRATDVLGWQPMPLDDGIRLYVREREELLR